MDKEKMTLEQKVGQMIVAGFPDKYYDDHAKTLIENYNIGNFILFTRNIGTMDELVKLTFDIQQNTLTNIGIPALIAIDQEGGMVTRIQNGATFMPGNMAFSAASLESSTFIEGEMVGEELRALGINMNLAPVLDINNNPRNPSISVRSYGDNAETVAKYGINYINGLQSKGVIATAKHFPGHGDTDLDSHLDLPLIAHNLKRLEENEMYPFIEAIKCNVGAIMTTHVLFPALEEEKLPATLSYNVLTGLLREKFGFKGLIITDCMEMKAISTYYGTSQAAVAAVKAGADLLCISHSLKEQIDSHQNIIKAVKNFEIPESRINDSLERIISIKRNNNLFAHPYPDFEMVSKFVGCQKNVEFAKNISRRSITVIKDERNLLPLKAENAVTISTEPLMTTNVEDSENCEYVFCTKIKEKIGGRGIIIPVSPTDDTIKEIADQVKNADRVIIGTYNACLYNKQADLVNEILSVNRNTIVVSLRSPYDFSFFKEVPTYICAYEYTSISVDSVINVILGYAEAKGKLPVNLGN